VAADPDRPQAVFERDSRTTNGAHDPLERDGQEVASNAEESTVTNDTQKLSEFA
jgi:hypothetical protein